MKMSLFSIFAVSAILGMLSSPVMAGRKATYHKVTISGDALYEGASKIDKKKFKTNDVINVMLEEFGVDSKVKAKNCKIIACIFGVADGGEINFNKIRWYLWCKKKGVNIDITSKVDGEPGIYSLHGTRFSEVNEFSGKGSGGIISGTGRSAYSFWEWGVESEDLAITSSQSGDGKVKVKNNKITSITVDAAGFHNISTTDEDGLGSVEVKISGREESYTPPAS